MFKFSFSNLAKKEAKEEDFPLISALNFGKIQTSKDLTSAPIICSNCQSMLAEPTDLKISGNVYSFECRFCMHKNQISKAMGDEFLGVVVSAPSPETSTTISAADLCYLLDQIKTDKNDLLKTLELKKQSTGITIQVAVIDNSGSMAGGKLEAVKHALVQAVHELTADHPKTNFVLVPFSTNVDVRINPEIQESIPDGPHFFKEEAMTAKVAEILKKGPMFPIEQVYEKWTNIIKSMHDSSSTALGPALFIGTQLISESQKTEKVKAGGKVLLLTDGLANVGIGSVEQLKGPEDKNRIFYHRVAEFCVQNNIIVDIIAVRDNDGGNTVALDIIGKVTDYTGGQMVFITSEQIESAFGELHRTNYIARNVALKVFAPEFLQLVEIQGAELLEALPTKNGVPIRLGAIYADREIYLKFKQKDIKLPVGTKIPIQYQLDYLDSGNAHRVRLFQQNIEIANDSKEFEKNFDAKVASAYEMARAAKYSKEGDLSKAKAQVKQSMMRNEMMHTQYKADLSDVNQVFESEMDDWAATEKQADEDQVADKKSFYMAANQSSARSSYDFKKKKMEAKKNK